MTQVPVFKVRLGLPKNVNWKDPHGLLMDGPLSRKYEHFSPARYRVFISQSNLESKYIVSQAITKSSKHGSTNLELPKKPFKTDLTICVDISSNPGPGSPNTIANLQLSHQTDNVYNARRHIIIPSRELLTVRRSCIAFAVPNCLNTSSTRFILILLRLGF